MCGADSQDEIMIPVYRVDDRGKVVGDPCALPEHEAHDLIIAGRATLHPRQAVPPWFLLKEVEDAISKSDRIGPQSTESVIDKISVELIPSGVRQTIFNGLHVPWARTSSGAQLAFRKALLGPSGAAPGIMYQIGQALSYRLARKEAIVLDKRPDAKKMEALGIIEVPDLQEAEWAGEWRCYGIGKEWSTFLTACMALSKRLDEALETALREGRLLIAEEIFPGARLLHPGRWQEEDYDPTNYPNDWFLMTRDLPREWFNQKSVKPKKRGRPRGRGGFEADDAPFVDLILEMLDDDGGITVNRAVNSVVSKHDGEIKGASNEAKVRRLMSRVSNARR